MLGEIFRNHELEKKLAEAKKRLAKAKAKTAELRRQREARNREAGRLGGTQITADRPRGYHYFQLSDVSENAPTFPGTYIPLQYLFDYLDGFLSLRAFLDDFPEVNVVDAIRAIRVHVKLAIPVHSDQELAGGVPVFKGSRVPIRYLFDHIAEGMALDEFLSDFPTSDREQVTETLKMASLLMEAIAYENSEE